LFLSGVVFSFRGIKASASNDKGRKPLEEDLQDPKLKEGQKARGSRAREPTCVGSINAGHAFSHNMQGPIPPIPDLSPFPAAEETLRVTDEFCAKYRVLKREVEILQEENIRLRRMLEIFLAPVMILHHLCGQIITQLGTPRGRYNEHSSKSSLSKKPRFIKPVGKR
jgi:hypothetical protein